MTNKFLGLLALIFFIIIASGLLWLAIQSDNAVSVLLSYAAGLSMIFLPCTLPLAFVVVPLAAREKGPGKGLGIALAFGLGLSVTLALYGILTAFLGGYFGLDQFTRAMFVVAGTMALLFALTEFGLLRIPLPSFGHRKSRWIKEGYGKTFLLGMILGNAGIGCPNPAFYVLLAYIASTGSAITGGWIGFVHGLGRATPLILLVLLTFLGIRGLDWMGRAARNLHVWTGTALAVAGAFILTYGLYGMSWWEDSVFHASWNAFIFTIAPNLAEAPDHSVAEGIFEASIGLGWMTFIVLLAVPLVWYRLKQGAVTKRFLLFLILLCALGLSAVSGILTAEHNHGPGVLEDKSHEH